MALCWICRQREATTREHRTKRSDLKRGFGSLTPEKPAFLNSPQVRRNQWVKSLDSDLLKSSVNICAHCNGTHTQPHDLAWDRFATYLDANPVKVGQVVRLNKIFPYDTRRHALGVHLYLAKKLGSDFVDHGHGDKVAPLANAIRDNRACSVLYLQLLPTPAQDGAYGQTLFDGWIDAGTNQLLGGVMEHFVAGGSMLMAYLPGMLPPDGLWHPRFGTSRLVVATPQREM